MSEKTHTMKTVYIDMDDVLCDFTGRKTELLASCPEMAYPQSQYGFYSELAPIKGAIKAASLLLASNGIEPYILTAPSVHNPLCYTEKRIWVENHLGMNYVNRLIISPDKSLLIGDYLIDDKIEGRGQEKFKGKLIQFGNAEYPDWDTVLELLIQKEPKALT